MLDHTFRRMGVTEIPLFYGFVRSVTFLYTGVSISGIFPILKIVLTRSTK